ncbi:HlfK/HlfC like regulator of protease activity [Mesorhizobium phage Cp1R7A-A1]|nr:HlfK/HlfC like regulator of protease activity [Mesorhizobium phage Cp1R7A-A1]
MRIAGFALGAVALIGAIGFFGCLQSIDEGERGVILRNGAYVGIAEPGLNFVNPLFDSIREISIRSNSRLYEKEEFYSFDRQLAHVTLSVTYKLDPSKIEQVYSEFGSEEGVMSRLVDRRVKKEVKEVLGQFTAATAIQERGKLGVDVTKAMIANISGPVQIESVQIEDIKFSPAYEQSIEQVMLADSKVKQLESEKRQKVVENEMTVAKAQADADAVVAKAKADADAKRLNGEGEADAIRAKGKALAENPGLTALITAENWKGMLPTTMVPGGAVPFINVEPK